MGLGLGLGFHRSDGLSGLGLELGLGLGLGFGVRRAWLTPAAALPRQVNLHDSFWPHVTTFLIWQVNLHDSFRPLPGERFLWASERSGWRHFAVHDASNGRQLLSLTRGEWSVEEVVRLDEASGTLYFSANPCDDPRWIRREPAFLGKHFFSVRLGRHSQLRFFFVSFAPA